MDTREAAVAALRERIRAIEGKRPVQKKREPTGVEALDALVRGLPRPGILELCGPRGGGRTLLALQLVARLTAQRKLVAWVDWERRLHPPAVEALGVDLASLLIVRPPGDQGTWAAEQLIRSGCFSVVVVADPSTTSRAGQRWALAAEYGQCSVIVLRQRSSRAIPAEVRLAVARDSGAPAQRPAEITVVRNRGETVGQHGFAPPLAEGADPWR